MLRPSNRNVTAVRRVRITSSARAAPAPNPVSMTFQLSNKSTKRMHFAGTSFRALLRAANSCGLRTLKLGQVLQKGPQPFDDYKTTAVGTGECQCRIATPCIV